MRSPARTSLPATQDDCSFLSPIKKSRSSFKCSSSHDRLQLPEDLVAEILVRLPVKSVARFRIVSTTWLSIVTDPSFILSHARRSRKSLIVRSLPTQNRQGYCSNNLIFSFSVSGFSCGQLSLHQLSDVARSSCNGLVLFWRAHEPNPPCEHYVMNPLTGLTIDVPNPNTSQKVGSMLELYYHRWTDEYRLLNISERPISSHLDAEVMSLAGACPSWRQIKAKAPFVSLFYSQSRVLVNDCLYWTCQEVSKEYSILVFDILKETFSLLELPSYSQKKFPSFADSSYSKFGLLDIEGNLCLWVVYRDKSCMDNVVIDIWAAVEGDEKWVNSYSLCLADEWRWALYYPFNAHLLIDCCFCIIETELLFLFDGRRSPMKNTRLTEMSVQYLFHWNLKSGKYSTEKLPEVFHVLMSPGIIHKETLIDAPFSRTTGIGALG